MNENLLTLNYLADDKKNSELFLIFNISEKTYALPADKIVEIVQLPALNVIEKFPDYIIGLLNLRGKIIPVVDLSKLLGIEQKTYTTDYQILILNCAEEMFGIVVSSVSDITGLDRRHFEPVPYKQKEKIISGICKHNNALIAFIDIYSILENIKKTEEDTLLSSEIKNKISISDNYFPCDEISKTKLVKRAEKLQKEIRTETGSLSEQENSFISFCLNNETYCINLKYVKEITKLKLVNLVFVPCVPEFIAGIINLRGEFITIIDIKYFLNLPKAPLSEKTKIIVVKISDIQIGLIVDDVFNIESIPNKLINLNSQTKYEKNKYTYAEVLLPDNQIMSVFDLKKFIDDERLYIEDTF